MANGWGSTGANIIMQQQMPTGASTWQQALGGMAQGLMAGYLTRSEREQELAARQQEYQMEMAKAQALADMQFRRDRELKMLDLESAKEIKLGDRGFEMEKLGKQHEYKLSEQQQSLLMDLQKLQTGKALDAQYAPSIAGASEAARLAAQERYGVGKGQQMNAKAMEEYRQGEALMAIVDRYREPVSKLKGISGTLGGIRATANKIASTLGMSSGDSDLLDSQARLGILGEEAANKYKAPSDPMTAAERQGLIENAFPSVGKTYEQNLAAIQEMENRARFMMRMQQGQQMPAQPQPAAATTEDIPPLDHLSTEQLQALRARLAGGS